jgi:hypothetical protein
MLERTVVIGDVHGCLEELKELLAEIAAYDDGRGLPKGRDRLIFVGDLVDRGPDPVGVVHFVQDLGAACVLGNHEEKHVRWAKHEARKAETGEPNPMRPFDDRRLAEHNALSEADRRWLAALPPWGTSRAFPVEA